MDNHEQIKKELKIDMANTGVFGRVIYTGTTTGIPNLTIEVVDFDGLPAEQILAVTTTDVSGYYLVTYPATAYGGYEWRPDIFLRVYDQYWRKLHETNMYYDVTVTSLRIADISLHPNNVSGWLVTNATINPAGTPVNLSEGNEIQFYIDNEDAWQALTNAAAAAISSINFQILFWDVPAVITKFSSVPVVGTPVTGEQLQVKFKELAARGVPVRVIMNDFNPDFWLLDTALEVTTFFKETTVDLRLYETRLQSPFHAKLMIVDGTSAYLIGSPIMNEYFDSQRHLIEETRRGSFGITNQMKAPIHEVSAKISGPAVHAIDSSFCLYWNRLRPTPSTPDLTPAPPVSSPRSGSQVASVQVLRTTPGNVYITAPEGETSILESYQRAIANADSFIYIENQYFTSFELVEAIIRRLRVNTALQVILVLNIKVDIIWYTELQSLAINQLLSTAERIGAQNRVGIYTLWSHEAFRGTSRIARNYVHSKTSIVDDKWATVGSANTDGTSLNQTQILNESRLSQHAISQPWYQPLRATELNLSIYNGIAGQPATNVISDLRKRLWQEHLGYNSADHSDLVTKPSDGWLSLWNTKADEKRNGLRQPTAVVTSPRILKWTIVRKKHSDTYSFLWDNVGYTDTRLSVWPHVRGFDFSTGSWE